MAILVLFFCLLAASCGGGGSSAPTTLTPANPNTFTITSTGVDPKQITVSPGTRVLFVNKDSRRHDMASDPHPEHNAEGCGGINSVGVLNPSVSRETLNMVVVRTCGFHDHDNPPLTTQAGNTWTGRIIIQ